MSDYHALSHVAGFSEADAQALADVRTLDEWVQRTSKDEWRRREVLIAAGIGPGWAAHLAAAEYRTFYGATPDAARHAAAEWVRGQK